MFWINNNQWYLNYWSESRFLPKIIDGEIQIFYDLKNIQSIILPWYELDWLPALKPYDITIPEVF
jgi:hypothetical protein